MILAILFQCYVLFLEAMNVNRGKYVYLWYQNFSGKEDETNLFDNKHILFNTFILSEVFIVI